MSKTMCKLAKKSELKEIADNSNKPRYICTKCGRVANEKDMLCKPEKLDAVE